MSTDEQYGQDLAVRLRQELHEVRAAPDLARTLRRRQTRRAWALRSAIAVPVAAAAITAVLVSTAGPGAPDPRLQADGGSTTQLKDVAYVQEQTIKALAEATDLVIYAKHAYDGGYYEEWVDKTTQRYRNNLYGPRSAPGSGTRSDGRAVAPPAPGTVDLGPIVLQHSHSASGPNGNRDLVSVNYEQQTWMSEHSTEVLPAPVVPDVTDPATMRAAVEAGTLELMGEETVNGVASVHLRMFAVQRGYRIDVWVDTVNFLPVQETSTVIDDQGPPKIVTTYSWLARTPENLAHLVLTPPAGFTRVP